MKYTKEAITEKLQAYPKMMEKLKLLQYELSHTAKISADEVLEAKAFGRASGEIPVKGSGPNLDKTLGLALSYREEARRLNQEAVSEVFQECQQIRAEVDRLLFYMSLLPQEHREVLRLCYMENLTWQETERETGYSRRTLVRRRNEAIERLTEMYNYTSNLTGK